MTGYGLSGVRDKNGGRKIVDHTYDYGGEEVTIRLKPPTVSQQEEYEDLGEEAGTEVLEEIIDKHLEEPTIPEDEEWTMRELLGYLHGIVDYSSGGGGAVADEIREELDDRQSQGN